MDDARLGAVIPTDCGQSRWYAPRSRRSDGASEAACRRIAQDALRACRLFNELGIALMRRTGSQERVSGSPDRSPTPRASVIAARTEIRDALNAVARRLTKELGLKVSDDSVDGVAGLITEHVQWLTRHCPVGPLERLGHAANSDTFWRLVLTSADWFFVGTCPISVADRPSGVCGTRLYQMAGTVTIQCSGCGTAEMIEWWQHLIAGTSQVWVDAYALADHLSTRWKRKVKPAAVRAWARRSSRTGVTARTYVDQSGGTPREMPAYDAKGRALYDFNAALTYAQRIWGPACTI